MTEPIACTASRPASFGAPPGIDGTLFVGAEHGDVVIHPSSPAARSARWC